MRKARVLFKVEFAGTLTQHDDGSFTYQYDKKWVTDDSKPSISLTMPKNMKQIHSSHLFSFFYNFLNEETNN